MNLLFVKELCYFYFLITQVVSGVLVIDLLIQLKTARYQEYSRFSGLEGRVYCSWLNTARKIHGGITL